MPEISRHPLVVGYMNTDYAKHGFSDIIDSAPNVLPIFTEACKCCGYLYQLIHRKEVFPFPDHTLPPRQRMVSPVQLYAWLYSMVLNVGASAITLSSIFNSGGKRIASTSGHVVVSSRYDTRQRSDRKAPVHILSLDHFKVEDPLNGVLSVYNNNKWNMKSKQEGLLPMWLFIRELNRFTYWLLRKNQEAFPYIYDKGDYTGNTNLVFTMWDYAINGMDLSHEELFLESRSFTIFRYYENALELTSVKSMVNDG
jgi:hypothetical protein